MQNILIDFVPVLLFLIAFKMYGIYVATTVGIIATAVQVVLTRFIRHRFDKQQVITLIVFVVFGGMTLYFHNPIFIKWKPSIIFWIFGLAFFFSQFIGMKPLAQRMLEGLLEGQATEVPRFVWTRLNIAWTIFFLTLGTVNIYVAYTFSTDTWVNFKVYGIMTLLLTFSFVQAMCLTRYLSSEHKVGDQ
jgi:intracellular septation protein